MAGLKPRTVQGRIERGWSIEKVIETPLKRVRRWCNKDLEV
nr:MAG TPA: PVL ORF-50-like family [Caudoviricetes sp.]